MTNIYFSDEKLLKMMFSVFVIWYSVLPESKVDGIIRVYNNPICEVIDNYNCSAYYEPSYVIARAYQNGGF